MHNRAIYRCATHSRYVHLISKKRNDSPIILLLNIQKSRLFPCFSLVITGEPLSFEFQRFIDCFFLLKCGMVCNRKCNCCAGAWSEEFIKWDRLHGHAELFINFLGQINVELYRWIPHARHDKINISGPNERKRDTWH